jgi:hypothetical protein
MQVLDHKGVKHILPLLTPDRVTEVGAWANLMYVFLAYVLIRLAKMLSQKFGGQSVAMLGTRVPITCVV